MGHNTGLTAAVVHKTLYAIGGSNGTRALDTVEDADLEGGRGSKLRREDAGEHVADGTLFCSRRDGTLPWR